MGIEIQTSFRPLRMVLERKEPVELCISLRNVSEEEKKLTLKVILTNQLAFDKSGYRNAELTRIDSIKPDEEKRFYYELHPKISIQAQAQPIKIRVQEHYQNYEYTQKQYEKEIELHIHK